MLTKTKSIVRRVRIDNRILAYKVVKSNDLIQSKSNFTAMEHRIILFALVQVKPTDEGLKPYRIKMSSISPHSNYGFVRKALQNLKGSTISILEKSRWVPLPFIESIRELKDYEISFEICFSKEIQRFLLNLRGSYTSYTLANVVKFHKNYSLRIYELCKQYSFKGFRSIKVDFLRMILSLENKYINFKHFELYVLRPSLEEINTHSDIFVKIDFVCNGRRVVSINFDISKKEITAPRFEVKGSHGKDGFNVSNTSLATGFDKITLRRLCILQFDGLEIDGFMENHTNEKMINALNILDDQTKRIKNSKGFLVQALKQGWIANVKPEAKNPKKDPRMVTLNAMLEKIMRKKKLNL